MKSRTPFIITVDTEADNHWKGGESVTLENLKAIPKFQEVCERYGFVPTYFITYEVTEDKDAVAYLGKLWREGKAEVGAHLHPWTTPPYNDEQSEKRDMPFPYELDDQLLREKFISLHHAINKAFGKAAVVFRAGRWGYDHRIGALLKEFGYIADTSITPLVDWGKIAKGGEVRKFPNFVHASLFPWRINEQVVELPMTVLPRGPRFVSRLADKVGRGTLLSMWCRIFKGTTVDELLFVYERVEKLNLPYCMFMIHSSEFILGSPYTKDERSLDAHLGTFEKFLRALHERGVQGMTVSQVSGKVIQ